MNLDDLRYPLWINVEENSIRPTGTGSWTFADVIKFPTLGDRTRDEGRSLPVFTRGQKAADFAGASALQDVKTISIPDKKQFLDLLHFVRGNEEITHVAFDPPEVSGTQSEGVFPIEYVIARLEGSP